MVASMRLPLKVNAHIHTPYSFSAFGSIAEALDMAAAADVRVVGINDFNTTDGFGEWSAGCAERGLFPLFGIEFISLSGEDQHNGVRVNDPNNPGRIYLSGKGLKCPPRLPEPFSSKLADVARGSNTQARAMCARLNGLLSEQHAGFSIDPDRVLRELTKGNIRERHLAKALRLAAYGYFGNDERLIREFFMRIFGGKELNARVADHAAVENEVRGNLMKAGGAAFVPEGPGAFLPPEDVCGIIRATGGIPTYPFLADDAAGNFTDFERDLPAAVAKLRERRIFSAEFIPTRNSLEVLEAYAGYLWEQGFIVTFGSEHNTPAMEPVELFARGGVPLGDKLISICYQGACVIAAHQDAVAKGREGYVNKDGVADMSGREGWAERGDRIIRGST